jgi:hypothetical protein
MAVTPITNGGAGFGGTASTTVANTGTATLQAGDEVLMAVVNILTSTVTGWTDLGTIASPGTNGGAELLDSIAHDGRISLSCGGLG